MQAVSSDLIGEVSSLVMGGDDCEPALRKAEALLRTDAASSRVWQLKGVCEFELRRFADAAKSFQKVLELDPSDRGALYYLGLLDPQSRDASESAAAIAEYMRSTGNVVQDHGEQPPPSFPADLPLGAPLRVLKSSTEIIKADGQGGGPDRAHAVFLYLSAVVREDLFSTLSSYFTREGYIVEMPQRGGSEEVLIATKEGGFRFSVVVSDGGYGEGARVVQVSYGSSGARSSP
jgi:tetratricopeptide (TPR) repeat protein